MTVKIFNIQQSKTFIFLGCRVISCGIGKLGKVFIEFEINDLLNDCMKRWKAKEF